MTDHRTEFAESAILFFLKAPRAGFVKTRLASGIGDAAALNAYRSLVERQAAELRGLFPSTVYYAPADSEPELSDWLGNEFGYRPQCDSDLGGRLKSAVSDAFDQGARSVICIGGDCPGLTRSQLHKALDILANGTDLVLGPTEDGGYYLIGLSRDRPELFDGIPWSQPDTFEATLRKAKGLQLKTALLEKLYDVDEPEDLDRAHNEGLLPN
ncbi:MAG: TIGR04282 family arsenosugar biosynthesis glycosyltransferase [Coraliomargarita sp.]